MKETASNYPSEISKFAFQQRSIPIVIYNKKKMDARTYRFSPSVDTYNLANVDTPWEQNEALMIMRKNKERLEKLTNFDMNNHSSLF